MTMTVETIASFELPVSERLVIERSRFGINKTDADSQTPRLCIANGTHGDETTGILICARLAAMLQTLESANQLHGTIDLYPFLNPLAITAASRNMPFFDADLNRAFGLDQKEDTSFIKELGRSISRNLAGADLVVHLNVSDGSIKVIPQIRCSSIHAEKLLPLANLTAPEFIWVHNDIAALHNSLAHELNSEGTPCFVLECGGARSISDKETVELICKGILNLARSLRIVQDGQAVKKPVPGMISSDGIVHHVHASNPGLFVPLAALAHYIAGGDIIGHIIDVQTGQIIEEICAPAHGVIISMREYPIIMTGSLLARVYEGPGAASYAGAKNDA